MSKFTKFVFQIMLVVLLCWGAYAWFTWEWDSLGLGRFYLFFVFIAITVIYVYYNKIKLSISSKETGLLVLWCIASLPNDFKLVSPIIAALRFFPLLILFKDKYNIESHLKFISVSVAIILIPGMILWTLIQMEAFTLPGIPIQMGDDDNLNYYFYNYFFLLNRIELESTRFQSIFLEPGYLGTMLAFLLYANKYKWKQWYNWMLLLGLILSQSLAGYITLLVGYILYLYQMKTSARKLLFLLAAIFVFFYFIPQINKGANNINHNIIERFTDKNNNKYVLLDDLRVSYDTDRIFSNLISSGNLFFGDINKTKVEGAGYKVFIIRYGLVAAIIYFFFYFQLSTFTRNKKYGKGFLLLVVLTFFQAAYPFSYSWVIPFVLGVLSDTAPGYSLRKYGKNEDLVC